MHEYVGVKTKRTALVNTGRLSGRVGGREKFLQRFRDAGCSEAKYTKVKAVCDVVG